MITNAPDAGLIQALKKRFVGATLVEYLGEGSFGVTYRVDVGSDATAVKILKPPYDVARTDREIHALSRVSSPHISRFIGEGELDYASTKLRFIRTEFLSGESLRGKLNKAGPLSTADIFRLLKHMASGLAALHSCGLTHRDLKPENIMLDGARYVIIDFGLVKLDGAASLTISGDFLGTRQYAALEQLISSKHVDIRADLFSLGMLIYESSKGSMQFPYHAGRDQSRLGCIQNLRTVKAPDTSHLGALGPIVSNLIAVQAYNRINSPADLVKQLRGI